MPSTSNLYTCTIRHANRAGIHGKAIVGMARILEERIKQGPLLAHVSQGKVSGAFIHLIIDLKAWRLGAIIREQVVFAIFIELTEVQSIAQLKRSIMTKLLTRFPCVNGLIVVFVY